MKRRQMHWPRTTLIPLLGLIICVPLKAGSAGLRADTDSLTESINKYCFSNNERWRRVECREITNELDAAEHERFKDFRYQLLLARAYQGINEYSEEEKEKIDAARKSHAIYSQLLQESPRNTEVLLQYAMSLSGSESIPVLRRLLTIDPHHYYGLTDLATNLIQLGGDGRQKEAAKLMVRAYEFAPEGMKRLAAAWAHESLTRAGLEHQAQEFRATVQADLGVDRDLRKMTAVVDSDASVGDKLAAIALLIDKYCIDAYLTFDDPEACHRSVSHLEEMSYQHPTNSQILQLMIKALKPLMAREPGGEQLLKTVYARLFEVKPDSSDALFDYSQLLVGDEQFELLKDLVKRPDAPAGAHYSFAQLLEARGSLGEAVIEYEKAFKLAGSRYKRSFGLDLLRVLEAEGLDKQALELKEQLSEIG